MVETGFIRLMMVMLSHSLSLMYEVMSGYLRGFGISLPPALLTMLGVCGVRIAWIQGVFPQSRTFKTIMTAYPISLSYQPIHNGAAGADRAAVLSSQPADRKRPCIKQAPLDRQLLSGAYLIKKCVLVSPPRIVYPMVVATRSEH